MAEKVIHEVRFIETDEGFRVEVKGDKERMREMGFGPGMFAGHHHPAHHGKRWKFGPRFRGCSRPCGHPEPEDHEAPAEEA